MTEPISPKFKAQSMIWNAYNRVGIEYIAASDPAALEPVQNPHFTYHPALVFQFKDGKSGNDFLSRGIADVGITLQQEGMMPWIPAGDIRRDSIAVDELTIDAPSEDVSVRMALDSIKPENARNHVADGQWDIPWHAVAIRLRLSTCPAQIATLSWFYFY
jgi:hypothetical protein